MTARRLSPWLVHVSQKLNRIRVSNAYTFSTKQHLLFYGFCSGHEQYMFDSREFLENSENRPLVSESEYIPQKYTVPDINSCQQCYWRGLSEQLSRRQLLSKCFLISWKYQRYIAANVLYHTCDTLKAKYINKTASSAIKKGSRN